MQQCFNFGGEGGFILNPSWGLTLAPLRAPPQARVRAGFSVLKVCHRLSQHVDAWNVLTVPHSTAFVCSCKRRSLLDQYVSCE